MKMENVFFNWYAEKATDEERYLADRAFQLGDLFNDMTFQPGSSTYSMIQCQSKSIDEDEWHDDEMFLPEELEYFDLCWFHWNVLASDEIIGNAYYDHKKQTVCVSREHLHEDSCILHELIHLHESVINELPLYFHDTVFWVLYHDLKTKIPKLDEIISTHAHVLNEYDLYRSGGLHDILFLLKSFDLDIRMGHSLGTVFAYGYKNDLDKYTYEGDTDESKVNSRQPRQNIVAEAHFDENGSLVSSFVLQQKHGTISLPVTQLTPSEKKKSSPMKPLIIKKIKK